MSRFGEHIGEEVVMCGLVIEQRKHRQANGESMMFLPFADWTGRVETELFADTCRSFRLATIPDPVLEVTTTV